jgi:hypothetical protein
MPVAVVPIRLCMGVAFGFRAVNISAAYRSGLLVFMLLSGTASTVFAQANEGDNNRINAALTAGIINTQFPLYADNSAGPNIAVFYQKSTFIGMQAKGGDYFYSARFKQVPITAGYRVGKPYFDRETSIWAGWYPFAYAGAGVSHAQDSDLNPQPIPAAWYFCMQGSAGVDHQFKYFTWRAAEVSWTETNTSIRSLRSIGISTGLVFHLLR